MTTQSASRCALVFLIVVSLPATLVACNTGMSNTQVYHTNLLLKIEVNRSGCLQIGDEIRIKLTAQNTGQKSIVIESQDMPVLDIGVRNTLKQTRDASWSSQNPDQVLHHADWKPGESKILELMWTVPKGDYAPGYTVSIAGFLSEGSKIVTSTGFDICIGKPFEPS